MLETDRSGATEAAIVAVEREVGTTLPSSYRAFLLRHDGGKPLKNILELSDGSERVVHVMLNTSFPDIYSILNGIEFAAETFPTGYLPIADDPGGNSVLIKTAEPETGGIFFWFHDRPAIHPVADSAQITKIADDFDGFARKLRE